MTDEEWYSIEYSVLMAAMPEELSRQEIEIWMRNARINLRTPYRNLLNMLRESYLKDAIKNGWKRPTN